MRKNVAAQSTQCRLEQHDPQETDSHNIECREPVVNQHLVHHHLEKQGGEQGENLQDKGNEHHLAQQLSVFHDGRDKPGEIESGDLTRLGGLRANEDQLAAPTSLQLVSGKYLGTLRPRVVNQDLVLINPGNDEIVAIVCTGNGRQRGLRKTIKFAAN